MEGMTNMNIITIRGRRIAVRAVSGSQLRFIRHQLEDRSDMALDTMAEETKVLITEQRVAAAQARNKCPRVALRIECPECGYPFSESRYGLTEDGEVIPEIIDGISLVDPGHKD
jgi:hypothetical protein